MEDFQLSRLKQQSISLSECVPEFLGHHTDGDVAHYRAGEIGRRVHAT